MRKKPTPPAGPAGEAVLVGKDGPQLIRSTGKRWTEEAEELFLDHLATTCNVTASAAAAGFSKTTVNARRRRDPALAQRWQAALETGVARIEALLLRRAEEALEGWAPETDNPIPPMSIKDALAIIGHHRRSVERGPRSRRQWARPRSLDELRDSILARLEAFVPHSTMALDPPREGEGDHPKDGGGDSPHSSALEENPLRQLCGLPSPREGEGE